MDNYAAVSEKVIGAVAGVLKKDPASIAGVETYQELGADDLDMFELVLKLEDVFMCEISDAEFEQLVSIPATVSYMCGKESTH